jgi:rubrerythrin
MSNIFAGSEIVEMGVQIERNGMDFYNALTSTVKDNKAEEVFNYLALEEEKHIAVFQKILDSVQRYEPQEAYPGEYFAYMKALADDYIFTKTGQGQKAAKGVKGAKEAIELGIGFEKDSILFYEGMKKVIPEYDRKIVEGLIVQEQSHLKRLSDLKKKL